MHHIEPFWRWRDLYKAEEDENSPFYQREYSEFEFTHAIYDYVIHPQWDDIGSPTLFAKILWADYTDGFCIIELIGEWNDLLHNDIMFLKRDVADVLIQNGIFRFIIIGENILNFHYDDTDYYEEWYDDIKDEGGWITFINFNEHVLNEMKIKHIDYYVQMTNSLQNIPWRRFTPDKLIDLVEEKFLKYLS